MTELEEAVEQVRKNGIGRAQLTEPEISMLAEVYDMYTQKIIADEYHVYPGYNKLIMAVTKHWEAMCEQAREVSISHQ